MESLSEIFSPFDDLEIICEDHGLPCIGLCCDYCCKEKVKFLCMKCVKSGNTCITKEKHELITLSEMLYRFFLIEENKSVNISQIQEMEQIVNEWKAEELEKVTQNFKSIQGQKYKKFDDIRKITSNLIKDIIQAIKEQNINKLNEINYKSKNIANPSEKELIFKMNIPKENITKNKDDIIKYINKKYESTNANDFVNQVKFLFDTHQFIKVAKNMNDQIYVNQLTNINEEKKEKMNSKIDSILKELEADLDSKLNQVEEEIILSMDNPSIYTSYNFSFKLQNDPQELVFKKDICSNAHKTNSIDRVFCAFKSFLGEALIVWGSSSNNIEYYDCEKEKIVKTFHQAHSQTVFSCRHYPYVKKRIDYIITSSYDRTVKLWDYNQNSYDLCISNAHGGYYIYSVSILFNIQEDKNYVITSSSNEKMKVWDFKGNYIRNFGQDSESTYFIDVYYSKWKKQYYIINANSVDVKSYEFDTGNLYHKYKGIPQTWHMSAVINETKQGQLLIESDGTGRIRIWDFNTANLLKNIASTYSLNLRGICLWNDRYLFAAGNDYQVKLFDLEEGKFIKSFKGHSSTVCTIEKIKHPKYGGCLISQGLDGKLKLWAPKE
jgi:WD40 repeat protein